MKLAPITISALAGQLSTSTMTVPLWGLVVFILWIITIVVLLITVRVRHLATGGSVKDFGTPDDASLLWRLFRVQSNLVENLPLYLGVVFLLTVRNVSGIVIDRFVSVYIIFRLFHSIVHIIGASANLRLLSLIVQLSCLISLLFLAIFQV